MWLAIFASNHKVVLYLAMTQPHGNEGVQQIAEPIVLRPDFHSPISLVSDEILLYEECSDKS